MPMSTTPNVPPENHTQPPQSDTGLPSSGPSSAPSWLARFTTVRSKRALENLFLNIALYLGSLLILSAAALLVNSVGTPPLQITLLALFTGIIYAAGLVTYKWVPRLRLASYSFTSTGLALIPFCGIAAYRLIWPFSGASLWLLVSLIGTVAVIGALLLMQARVMSYLALAFVVSDVLAVSKTLQVGLIWYFISLLLLACVLELFTKASSHRLPQQLHDGFRDSSRVFVPLTMLAALVTYQHLELWELGVIFAAGTIYSLIFFTVDFPLLHFIEARTYSFLATCFFTAVGSTSENPPLVFKAFYLPALLLLISAILLLFLKVPLPKYKQHLDATITYGVAQLLLFVSLGNLNSVFELGAFFPALLVPDSYESGYLFAIIITVVLLALNAVALVLLSRGERLRPYLPLIACAQAFLMLWTMSWHGILAGLIGQASAVFLIYYPGRVRRAVAYATPFLLSTLAILIIPNSWGTSPALTFYIIGLGCAVNYLYTVLTRPVDQDGLPNHLSLAYHCAAWMAILLPPICHLSVLHNSSASSDSYNSVALVGSIAEALFLGVVLSSLLVVIGLGYYTKTAIYQTVQNLESVPLSPQKLRFFEGTDQSSIPPGQKLSAQPPAQAQVNPQIVSIPVAVDKSPKLLIFVLYSSVEALLISVSMRYSLSHELVVLAGMMIGLMSVFKTVTAKARIHCGILIRALLAWGGFLILFAENTYSLDTQVLLICAIFATLAVVSIFAYGFSDGSQKNYEKFAALFLSAMALVLTFVFAGTLHSSDTNGHRLLSALVLLALLIAWFRVSRAEETTVAQSALALQALTLVMLPLFTTSQGTLNGYGLLVSGVVVGVAAKLCAVFFPELAKPLPAHEQSYLGRWGYHHNRAIALSGAAYASFILAVAFIAEDITPAVLAALVLTLYWTFQVKTQYQPIVLIVGINVALLRIFIAHDLDNSFFYGCQAFVMSLSMLLWLSKVPLFAEHHKPKKELFWTAFSVQGLLVVALQTYVGQLSLTDRLLMVCVSLVLLGASAVFRLALQPVLVTVLMTYQVLYLLGGINIITLFGLGFLLIGIVIWRLLARKDDDPEAPLALTTPPASGPEAATPAPTQSQPFAGTVAQPSVAQHHDLQAVQTAAPTNIPQQAQKPAEQQSAPPVAPWVKGS